MHKKPDFLGFWEKQEMHALDAFPHYERQYSERKVQLMGVDAK